MSKIYVEEIDRVSDCERDLFYFDNEDAALKEAASDLLNEINGHWDLCDDDERSSAQEIQEHIRNGRYRQAIQDYNDRENNQDSPIYISVRTGDIKSYGNSPQYINFAEYEPEEDEDDEDDTEFVDNSPYLAPNPGAVCRGPCGNPSADAHADRRDGTFECYQCKLMKQAFGT